MFEQLTPTEPSVTSRGAATPLSSYGSSTIPRNWLRRKNRPGCLSTIFYLCCTIADSAKKKKKVTCIDKLSTRKPFFPKAWSSMDDECYLAWRWYCCRTMFWFAAAFWLCFGSYLPLHSETWPCQQRNTYSSCWPYRGALPVTLQPPQLKLEKAKVSFVPKRTALHVALCGRIKQDADSGLFRGSWTSRGIIMSVPT